MMETLATVTLMNVVLALSAIAVAAIGFCFGIGFELAGMLV